MLDFFYNLIIFPLVQLLELSYVLVYKVSHEPVVGLFGVSIAVSVFTLPLYFIAEKYQIIEREIQRHLKPKSAKIKMVFKGDEQYMVLSTYYRQNHYHPVYVLRSSLGLLIQVPFFIAAYSYLTHLTALQGVSFLFIKDLGMPDGALLFPGDLTVNILPVIMTIINCIAGAVYVKGFEAKEKFQLYGMAFVFLVLLYNSPAGLVLYWTMNNIFSLAKNCLQKIKNAKKIIWVFLCGCAIVISVYILGWQGGALSKRIAASLILASVFFVPIFKYFINGIGKKIRSVIDVNETVLATKGFFLLCILVLFVLAGLVIPSMLISSSVQEFSFIEDVLSPIPFILNTLMQSAGLFLFWTMCIYFLLSKKAKAIFCALMALFSITAVVNTFIFSGNYSSLTTLLTFETAPKNSFGMILINIAALIIIMGGGGGGGYFSPGKKYSYLHSKVLWYCLSPH